jgi:RNA polymerase sigma-70 factor (ECF subfamily)
MSEWEITLGEAEAGPAAELQTEVRLSLDEAFTAHHRLVYRYAYSLVRDGGLAEDVTQEVFLRLHGHLDSAQQGGMLRPWLLRVTANLARNVLRTRRRAACRDEAFEIEKLQSREAFAPDEALERKIQAARAQRVLGSLQEPYRTCLLLRHEGLSYREIAGTLGLKESCVGSFIVRGRNEFVKLYKEVGQDT